LRWGEVPRGARRYILYHTLVSPVLITSYMVPLYMLMTGYSILEVGVVFSLVRVASVPATLVVGRLFDRVPLRYGLAVIDVLEGFASLMYGLAKGVFAPLALAVGLLAERVAGLFYPLYQAAERLLYPEDRLEEVFAWHMRLPEASQLVGFLVLGYLFGHVYTGPEEYRLGFLAFSLYMFLLAPYVLSIPGLDAPASFTPPGGPRRVRVDRDLRLLLVLESLVVLGWSLAPGIVLLYYVVEVLGYTLFEVMLVEAGVSLASIAATYASDMIPRTRRFQAVALGYTLITLATGIMILAPPLPVVILAYAAARFGDTLSFPHYRAWLYEKIPREKSASLFAAISSLRRLIALASPAIAGALATLAPTLPYLASLTVFIIVVALLIARAWREHEAQGQTGPGEGRAGGDQG